MKATDQARVQWAEINQTEAVGRVFKSINSNIGFKEGSIPGRYWKSWSIPEDATDFDLEIRDFISECQENRPNLRADLYRQGIECPYYAWRFHLIIATHHAAHTYKNVNRTKKKEIEEEIEIWKRRISLSKSLIGIPLDRSLPYGNVYFIPAKEMGKPYSELYVERAKVVEDLKSEIERDEKVIKTLQQEVDRLNRLIPRGTGNAAPDLWKTPFFIYLANLWKLFADQEVPFDCKSLNRILQSATLVISGGDHDISEWSLVKTLRNVIFKDNTPGSGLRIYEHGIYAMTYDERLHERGRSIGALVRIGLGGEGISRGISTVAAGALWLRDHCEGNLSLIMREAIIRRGLIEADISCPELLLQLGWQREATPQEIRSALRDAVKRTNNGDLAAASVVEIVCRFNGEHRELARSLGWASMLQPDLIKSMKWELLRRNSEIPDRAGQSGDHKAFHVAMSFFVWNGVPI